MQYEDEQHLRAVVRITSGKWLLPIVHVLHDGTKRYHEIHAALPDITQKVLTDRLRKLEGYGFINRVAYPTIPPRVEYTLTELGESLAVAFTPVVDWAKTNLHEMVEPEEVYSLR